MTDENLQWHCEMNKTEQRALLEPEVEHPIALVSLA